MLRRIPIGERCRERSGERLSPAACDPGTGGCPVGRVPEGICPCSTLVHTSQRSSEVTHLPPDRVRRALEPAAPSSRSVCQALHWPTGAWPRERRTASTPGSLVSLLV